MVAVAAEQELTTQQAVEPRRRRRRWLFAAALVLLAGSCGFLAVAKLRTDPNEQLLRDLSTIENVEAYHQVGDIDFLHKLNDEGLFSDDAPDPAAAKTAPGAPDTEEARPSKEPPPSSSLDSPDQRREYLAKMSPQAKDELRAKFEMFEALSPDEQNKLRKLDDELNSEKQEDRLRRVLGRYSDWLKTLLTTERDELRYKTPTDRLKEIRNLRHAQEARLAAFTGASQPDVAAIHVWMAKFAENHQTELLKDPPKRIQDELKTATGRRRTQLLIMIAWQHWRKGEVGKSGEDGKTVTVSEEELNDLRRALSTAARQKLLAEPDKQIEAIERLVRTIAQASLFNRRGGARSNVTVEDLHKSFEELPPHERDRLLGLPREEMDQQLRAKYFRQKVVREPGQRDGPPPGDNPAGRDSRAPRERPRGNPKPEAGATQPNSPEKEADPPVKPNEAASSPVTPGNAASK